MRKIIVIVLIISVGIAAYVMLQGGLDIPQSEEKEIITSNSYRLVSPSNSKQSYLLNDKDQIVHVWTGDFLPGKHTMITPEGNLIRSESNGRPHINFKGARGSGGLIQKLDWNGDKLEWFKLNNEKEVLHHDFELMNNGNILTIAWEAISIEEAVAHGRNPDSLPEDHPVIWSEKVIEVDLETKEVVWEWRAWDHVAQDFDSTKSNYVSLAENQHLIDINSGWDSKNKDWIHLNAVDYNEELDQIIVSSPSFSEFWIIDHKLTTEEASKNTGGRYGVGGGLLFRWGNSQTYGIGDESSQELFRIHDAQWINEGLPGYNNILLFMNGAPNIHPFSKVMEVTLPVNRLGQYEMRKNEKTNVEVVWEYQAREDQPKFASHIVSGAQRLPNGNTFITQGVGGRIFEVNTKGDIVNDFTIDHQKSRIIHLFKSRWYPSYYPGFLNKDLQSVISQDDLLPGLPSRDDEALQEFLKKNSTTTSEDS